MNMQSLLNLMHLCFPLILLILGCVVGKITEWNHYKMIKKREEEWLTVPALTAKNLFRGITGAEI